MKIILNAAFLLIQLTLTAQADGQTDLKYWAWMSGDPKNSREHYETTFNRLHENGIDAVLINTNGDPEQLEKLTHLAAKADLEVHAWLMTMNRPGDTVALQHPEWYAVSRDGGSCFDTRPYVDYYQWLCPVREASRNHVLDLISGLAMVGGVGSIHLDYIRFSDVFLPIGLLPKYDLVQEEELPQFDFCYCEKCVEAFESGHHKNPLTMANPALDMEWRQFRLNAIKQLVDDAYEIVHANGKYLTAAVFPYPEMAAQMVRQRWDKWNIDTVLPMVYHNFYNEGLDWIGFVTAQGVQDLQGTNTDLHTGLYIPEMSPGELQQAIQLSRENGAEGVAFFDAAALTDEHLSVIRSSKSK